MYLKNLSGSILCPNFSLIGGIFISDIFSYKINVQGVVQGVGFRPFVYRLAQKNDLKGYVLNLGGSGVEIRIQGQEENINDFIKELKNNNPPLSRIDKLNFEEVEQERFDDFKIKKSLESVEGSSSSVIPPDVSICDECVEELFDPGDRRYKYPFIVCTNCGPRYSIIKSLPYDRENTTMKEFEMCDFCRSEYEDPANRRYHAQPVSCSKSGPEYSIYEGGDKLNVSNPIKRASNLIANEKIGVIKGIGGMHIACDASSDSVEVVERLRDSTNRLEKPFAIMARDLESVKEFANISRKEEEELKSYRKPITLLEKKSNFNEVLNDKLAPGLHNIGVMLPYSGLHHLIFNYLDVPALVMTSANMPGKPMIIKNTRALKELEETVDFFLLHNREIENRTDDSIVRFLNNQRSVIRRSRGFVPLSIETQFDYNGLALGAELSNTISIVKSGSIFPSQHLGDTTDIEAMEFLKKTKMHLTNLLKVEDLEMVLTDLHPLFNTTDYGMEISDSKNIPHYKVQHHVSHAASLLVEHPENEMVVIDADGAGQGWDGQTWGGEVIYISNDEIKRTHHIDYYPLPGGDLAAKYPIRSLIGILNSLDNNINLKDILYDEDMIESLKHGEKEIRIIQDQISKEINVAYTSSTGRFLDAISCLLGVACNRNYEGEPAMKLESFSRGGKDLGWKIPIEDNLIKVQKLITKISDSENKRKDIGYTIHKSLGRAFARAALKSAKKFEVDVIGFTGGVSNNELITNQISKTCNQNGYSFRQTNEVPRGDGGVSVGQAYLGGLISEGKMAPENLN